MARIFKIGLTEIPENDSTKLLTPQEVAQKLAGQFPELKNATHKVSQRGDDEVHEWTSAPGRKG